MESADTCMSMNAKVESKSGDFEVRVTRQSSQMDSHADHSNESAVSYALVGGAADQQNDDEGMAVPMDDNWEFGDVPVNDVQGQKPPLAPWSLAGLKLEQQEDQDISFVMKLMEDNVSKPSWKDVALSSHGVKTLWTQWPRLAINMVCLNDGLSPLMGSLYSGRL